MCALTVGSLGLGLTSGTGAAHAAACDNPPSGSMCVHVRHPSGSYQWLGPWYYCQIHNIAQGDEVTWISDNQYTGTRSWVYVDHNGKGASASFTAPYHDRPPWWDLGEMPGPTSVRVC